MARTIKCISLTDYDIERLNELMSTGNYKSESECMRFALCMFWTLEKKVGDLSNGEEKEE